MKLKIISDFYFRYVRKSKAMKNLIQVDYRQ